MNQAELYMIRTDTVRKANLTRLAERMPSRVKQAGRYVFERDRLLCLGAGLLMLEALDLRDEREIRYGPYGKPYVPGCPAFNISHSGSLCILARGDAGTIGADIEVVDERQIEIADAVYTGAELEWMQEDPVERFFRLWTWKESVMKASGLGMNMSPKSFEVLPFAEGKPVRIGSSVYYAQEDSLEHSRISVCSDEKIDMLQWHEVTQ